MPETIEPLYVWHSDGGGLLSNDEGMLEQFPSCGNGSVRSQIAAIVRQGVMSGSVHITPGYGICCVGRDSHMEPSYDDYYLPWQLIPKPSSFQPRRVYEP